MLIFVLLATMFTAGDLKQECARRLLDQSNFCLGFLTGFERGVGYASAVSPQAMSAAALDIEAGVKIGVEGYQYIVGCNVHETIEQIRLVFLKYVDNHPEELHLSAEVVVSRAMLAAFPCRTDKGGPR